MSQGDIESLSRGDGDDGHLPGMMRALGGRLPTVCVLVTHGCWCGCHHFSKETKLSK